MQESKFKNNLRHIALFVITFITTTLAGAEWIYGGSFFYTDTTMGWDEFVGGMEYSIPFLLILTVHEFGHYLVAKKNKVDVSMPFYLPMWMGFLAMPSLGTFGAFIKIKGFVMSKRQHFDIGIAGPLAGFVIAVGVLWIGYANLPNPEYVYQIHPDYEQYGLDYEDHVYTYDYQMQQHNDMYLEDRKKDSLAFVSGSENGSWFYPEFEAMEEYPSMAMGKPLLMLFFEKYVVDDPIKIPNAHEMMHYPWLLAGFLALLFTALNLLPIGQLDGGHVLYGLLGSKLHKPIAEIIFIGFILYAGMGVFSPYQDVDTMMWGVPVYIGFLFFTLKGLKKSTTDTFMFALAIFAIQFFMAWIEPTWVGYEGWLVFAFLIGRFLGVHHPPALDESPLDSNRQLLGWLALLIFVISFTPAPIVIG